MTDDTLPLILHAAPAIERAVRASLATALDLRRYRDAPLDARGFANATLGALAADPAFGALDAVGRHDLDALALRTATGFAASKLVRRLFSIPLERLVVPPSACDAAVRDDAGAIHLIRIETFVAPADRLTAVRELAGRTTATGRSPIVDGARPVVHCFSLRDGRLRSFGRKASVENALRAVPSRAA